jgi:hypothetical protein
MKALFDDKDTNIRFLDNDTLKIIKNRLFATDMFYYPAFIKIFFIKNGKKIYMDHHNETTLDNDFVGDINVEFIGNSITQEELTVFRIDPEGIVGNIIKTWDIASEEEIKFIMNKMIDNNYENSVIEGHIKRSHKKALDFIKKYDGELKNIPKSPTEIIGKIKIENVQFEAQLNDPDDFSVFIKNKFASGASEDIPFILLKTNKGSKIKTIDAELKQEISKKDLLDRDMILFMTKGDNSRYIFTLKNKKLFIHSPSANVIPHKDINKYIKNIKTIDMRYSAEINNVFDVKKLPQVIKEYYETFFKNKEFIRKGNSILLEYIRTKHGEIKVSVKNSKDGVVTPITIYNMNSKFHLGYVLSALESLITKSLKYKTQKNFFEEDTEEILQKEVKNIKKLKTGGISSVVCQKQRQPEINNERDKGATHYELVHKGNRYLCNNSPYLFPGFTVDENVCCFKKDQRRKEIYHRLTGNNINKIKVRASNLVINGKRIIKDENDNYFYIKKYDPLEIEKITDKKEIKKIQTSGDVWLKESVLGKVLYTNSKDCKKSPKLINGDYVCKNVGPIKYHFGYTESSIPCCFKEPRPALVNKQHAELQDTEEYYDGKYIITTEKSIDRGRVGLLPEEIYYMVSLEELDFKTPEKNKYFRLGSKRSLKEQIVYIFEKMYSKPFVVKDLVSREIFKLSRSDNFKSFEEYKKYLEDEKEIDVKNIIDYISLFLNTNIILLDFHSDDIEKCVNIYGKNKNSIILIQNDGYYEIVCFLEGKRIVKMFKTSETVVKNIRQYLKFKCNMNTDDMKITLKELSKELKKDGKKIKSQVVSATSNKVLFLETLDGVFLPVFPTRGLKRNIPEVYINDVNIEIDEGKFKIFLQKYAKYYKKIDFIKNGVLLNNYLILPTKNTYNEISVKNISYVEGMFKNSTDDKRTLLVKKISSINDYYYSLKYKFSEKIDKKLKEKINNILLLDLQRQQKFNQIKKLVETKSDFRNKESYYITQQLLGINAKDILDQLLPVKKIKMIKINFKNYRQLLNWIKL